MSYVKIWFHLDSEPQPLQGSAELFQTFVVRGQVVHGQEILWVQLQCLFVAWDGGLELIALIDLNALD